MIPGDIPSFFPVESLFQNAEDSRLPSTTLPLVPGLVAQDFNGDSSGMVMRRSVSFSAVDLSDQEMQLDDEMSEDGGALGEKKRRLSLEQVKALERSFELGNKLEPERKMQLARALGLKPKQVGIWFQNRRARWKTKQMEKDFEELKKQLELLKADNEVLRTQNKQFHSELMVLRSRESSGVGPINLNRENEASWSNGSEGSVEVNPGITGTRHVFPSGMEQPGVTHLFEGSGHQQQPTFDGGLSNMLNGVEEQSSFWAWPEHPNFR